MALWESVKKGAEEGFESLKESMTLFVAEAGKQGKIIRKRVELSAVQNNVRRAFIRLGTLTYDLHTRREPQVLDDTEIQDLIAEIDDYKARVREIELEIEAMKREEGSKKASEATGKEKPPSENQN
jgi:hypothetical protein